MTKKLLLLYDMRDKKPTEKTDITRKLFGFQDISNNSDYTYKRRGLLGAFKYKKMNKVTILIEAKDKRKIKKILNQFGLKCIIAEIKSGKRR